MAYVIKCLLTSECIVRTYMCIIVQPIKSMYFLYAWQPETLIRLALWVSVNTVVTDRELYQSHSLKAPDVNTTLRHIYGSLNETETEMRQRLLESNVWSSETVEKQIHLICTFTNGLQDFGIGCWSAFEMSTSILR